MKKTFALLFLTSGFLYSHFLTLIPTTDYTSESKISLDASFIHPFEQTGMTMEKPEGIYVNNKNNALKLKESSKFGKLSWESEYEFNKPGLYQFFVVPKPYFEPSEGKFISHVPKIYVSAYGYEDGWDKPLGLKYEILPITRPFGLYKGNMFQGQVLHNGKPASNVEVEVELFNEFGLKAPSDAHITQVIKTDKNGVFSFVMNHKGWWGFAALIEEGEKKHENKNYPIENGALLWIKAY